MARHDEKTSADRVKMLSGGDTGDRLAEVDKVCDHHISTQTVLFFHDNLSIL